MSDADAGSAAIAQLFRATPMQAAAMAPDGPGIEASANAGLHLAVGNLVSELRAEAQRKARLAADVSYIKTPGQSFASLPGTTSNWGPGIGYCWAVQRITVAGFGATTDFVIAYRGNSNTDAIPMNALFTFQETVAGGTSTWHPGRTGLVLTGDESLVFGGTFTGTACVISIDAIQLTNEKMAYFLL